MGTGMNFRVIAVMIVVPLFAHQVQEDVPVDFARRGTRGAAEIVGVDFSHARRGSGSR